jgi:hypothetical protein
LTVRRTVGTRSVFCTTTMEIRAIGTPTKNVHRQPRPGVSTSRPPISGPETVAAASTEPM